jgi:putative hemolysin
LDDLPLGWLIGGGVLMLLTRTLLGVADSNLMVISRARLRQIEGEKPAAARLDGLLDDRHRLHACLALCRTTLSVVLGGFAVWVAKERFPLQVLAQGLTLAATVVGTLLVETVARRLALASPERLGASLVPFYLIVDRLASPVVEVFSSLSAAIARLAGGGPAASRPGEPEVASEDIHMLVEARQDLEENEKEMIHSIFGLSDTLAREVMVPRVDIVGVDVSTSLERVLDLCVEHGISRLPVYEGTVDNVVGVVSSRDLLGLVKESRMDVRLGDIVRPAYFVPGSKKVDELLRDMQREKVSMAIVVDEYGGTDGLITMEDLVEEIVGEITDEYDRDVPVAELLENGAVSLDAKMIIEDANALLDIALPADEYETVGGYVYGLLGHVPHEGETTESCGLTISVEEVRRQRITKIRVAREEGEPFVLPADSQASSAARGSVR